MRAIDFPESNAQLCKPEGLTDEECYSVSAYLGFKETEGGQIAEYINTVWMPNKEDIEAINAGRPIILHMMVQHDSFPPLSLFTADENGEINE